MKIGIMSFAHTHAASYVRLLREQPDVELRAADPGPHPAASHPAGEVRGEELARQLDVAYCDGYDELMAWGPDAVLITSENARHRPLAELAASRGAHILCEKPLATTWADGLAIARAARTAGVTLMMAFPVRFASVFARLRAQYAAGLLGDIVSIRGTNNGKLPAERAWFADPELAGGGAFADHVVHIADLIEALTRAEPLTVTAVSNRKLYADRARAETAGLVMISYAGGVIAALDCSWSRPATAPTWGGLTLSVAGTLGSADLDFFGPRARGLDAATGRPIELPYGPDLNAPMLREFLGAIRTGHQPQPDASVGLRTLAVMLGAQQSARTGTTVALHHLLKSIN
jgi:1,5-anhydro-D-fructose reductase (1,5-anhydro-D-mannitol-forming)